MKAQEEGTFRHGLLQLCKFIAYRSRVLNFLSRPTYPYGLEPILLAFLVNALGRTANLSGAIVEVGVARGMTTVFLNEHLRITGDTRQYICIDTFSGFTESDIQHEVVHRSKPAKAFSSFRYNDRAIFERNLRKAGFANVKVIQTDIRTLCESELPEVSVAIVDVDLLLPTESALRLLWNNLQIGGVIVVDDVKTATLYDGAAEAYYSFCKQHRLHPSLLGTKSGIIEKTSS